MTSYQIVTGGTAQPGQKLPIADLQSCLNRIDKTGKTLEEIKAAVEAQMIEQGADASDHATWREFTVLKIGETSE